MNTLCYLIKLVSLFPSYIIYSPFFALSIFAALSNFCRIIKLLPSWGFGHFFIEVYISLMISQDIIIISMYKTAHTPHHTFKIHNNGVVPDITNMPSAFEATTIALIQLIFHNLVRIRTKVNQEVLYSRRLLWFTKKQLHQDSFDCNFIVDA